jgi:hypothetical protein
MTETHYLADILALLTAAVIARFRGTVRDRGERAA